MSTPETSNEEIDIAQELHEIEGCITELLSGISSFSLMDDIRLQDVNYLTQLLKHIYYINNIMIKENITPDDIEWMQIAVLNVTDDLDTYMDEMGL